MSVNVKLTEARLFFSAAFVGSGVTSLVGSGVISLVGSGVAVTAAVGSGVGVSVTVGVFPANSCTQYFLPLTP